MFSGWTFVALTMCTCDTVKFISNSCNVQQHPLCIGAQVISSHPVCIGSAVNMSGQFTYGLCDCFALRWRHNDHAGVSNHQPPGCLLNRLFRRKSKKTSKLRVTGLCAGNSPGTGEFSAQMASYAENVSIWWRHHGDWRLCCIAFWVPCLQVGQNAEYFGEDKTAACWLNFCFNCPYEMLVRHRLRLLRGIPGSMTTDMALTFLCGFCVLVQDAREIDVATKAGLTSGQVTVTAVSNPQDMDIKRI